MATAGNPRKTYVDHAGLRVVLADSITQIDEMDDGAVVVTGSHGGTSSAHYALQRKPAAVFFNDAGIGKNEAGTAALAMLGEAGFPAAAISHDTARIGDAEDAWREGVLSRVNGPATRLGLKAGMTVQDAASRCKV